MLDIVRTSQTIAIFDLMDFRDVIEFLLLSKAVWFLLARLCSFLHGSSERVSPASSFRSSPCRPRPCADLINDIPETAGESTGRIA